MFNMILKPQQSKSSATKPTKLKSENRRGSAMLIVISLLFTLFLLGTFFARFVSTELSSAQWFAKNAKEADPTDNSDVYFDWALEQIIIGPRANQGQSAVYGLKHALVPGVVGSLNGSQQLTDAHVYTGNGVRVLFTDANDDGIPDDANFGFDYNNDGIADVNQNNFILNFSPAANGGTSPLATNPDVFDYEPDVGYTYPDINNMALAHLSYVDIDPDPTVRNLKPVWIPSFHRPQYLVNWRTSGPGQRSANNPWTNLATANQVLRPHVGHVTPRLDDPEATGPRFDPNTFPGLAATDVGPDEGIWTITDKNGVLRNLFDLGANPVDPTDDNYSGLFSDVNHEYDMDADGDGVKEAIFLDLGFPVADNDGQLFTPIYGLTILDADALLNVNVHGNPHYFNAYFREAGAAMVGAFDGTMTDILRLNSKESYSQSGSGLSPFEVNLTRGFYAGPRTVESDRTSAWFDGGSLNTQLEQYRGMFDFSVTSFSAPLGVDPNTGGAVVGIGPAATHSAGGPGRLTNVQIANMEMARLIYGSLQYDGGGNIEASEDALPGRYGDQTELETFRDLSPSIGFPIPFTQYFPAPGLIEEDDDVDTTTGAGQGYRDPDILNALILPSFHPVDIIGMGGGVLDPGNALLDTSTFLVNPTFSENGRLSSGGTLLNDGNNPSQWPAYGDFWFNHDNAFASNRREYNQLPGPDAGGNPQNALMPNQRTYWLQDEPDELIVEPELAEVESDQIYPASEMLGLHLKGTDFVDISASSRLRTLLPFNFGDHNNETRFIREQFTTASWDRLEFSFSPSRTWEFNNTQNVTRRGNRRFPPRFGTTNTYGAIDPYRPATRQLLSIEIGRRQTDNIFLPQRKLRFNQIVDTIPPTQPERAIDGQVQYRNLIPHPVFQATDNSVTIDAMWHRNDKAGAPTQFTQYGIWQNPSTDPTTRATQNGAQEWWARYDRQRLARDIFVLLYTLGYGDDAINMTSASATVLTANDPDANMNGISDRIDAMAQLAVNIVDANDSDNVITRFEYDGDLSDGWNNADQIVYGVESQELTFSELLWLVIRQNSVADHTETYFDDTGRDHQYLFMELRNTTPRTITLADGSYRIRRVDDAGTQLAALTFQTGGSGAKVIAPGDNFLVGTTGGDIPVSGGADDGEERAAVFRMQLDYDDDGSSDTEYRAIVPSLPEAPPTTPDAYPDPFCDLDLSHRRDRDFQLFAEHGSTVGYFLPTADPGNGQITTTDPVRLVLERRQHNTSQGKIPDANNVWVEVDSANINAAVLDLGTNIDQNALYNQDATSGGSGTLPDNIISRERAQPFTSNFSTFSGANRFYRHSLGGPVINSGSIPLASIAAPTTTRRNQGNSNAPSQFDLWQPHFDRPFSSVFDVLSVPLFGPDAVITDLAPSGVLTDTNVAGTVFLNPGAPTATAYDPNIDNRWYRILEFFEVDPQVHTNVRNQLEAARLPGKVNLNTIRNTGPYGYLSSLSALIDDDHYTHSFSLLDRIEPDRHWGDQFLVARDGFDPVWASNASPVYVPLPGTPGSKPFRPLGYVDTSSVQNANSSAQHTILRKLPFDNLLPLTDNGDPNPRNRRQLFEAQTATDIISDPIDFHSRHRLLSKIANNSTTKSHVFIIWIGVQFHAVDDTNGYYQVGEQLTYNSADPIAPDNDPRFTPRRGFFIVDRSLLEQAYDPNTRKFDFRKFVVFRKTISEP